MRYLKNVVTLSFESGRCTGCGLCTQVCPQSVWSLENGKAQVANRDQCIECGACAKNCAANAISVRSGVGCAAAMFNGLLRKGDPSKGCCGGSEGGCC